MNAIQKRRGQYLGTKIEHKWWRRYIKGGFFTRGIGEYWIKGDSLFFQHQARQEPIVVPLGKIVEIKICPCHKRARLQGEPIIKLVWVKDGTWLSSDFILSGSLDEDSVLLASLRSVA